MVFERRENVQKLINKLAIENLKLITVSNDIEDLVGYAVFDTCNNIFSMVMGITEDEEIELFAFDGSMQKYILDPEYITIVDVNAIEEFVEDNEEDSCSKCELCGANTDQLLFLDIDEDDDETIFVCGDCYDKVTDYEDEHPHLKLGLEGMKMLVSDERNFINTETNEEDKKSAYDGITKEEQKDLLNIVEKIKKPATVFGFKEDINLINEMKKWQTNDFKKDMNNKIKTFLGRWEETECNDFDKKDINNDIKISPEEIECDNSFIDDGKEKIKIDKCIYKTGDLEKGIPPELKLIVDKYLNKDKEGGDNE